MAKGIKNQRYHRLSCLNVDLSFSPQRAVNKHPHILAGLQEGGNGIPHQANLQDQLLPVKILGSRKICWCDVRVKKE